MVSGDQRPALETDGQDTMALTNHVSYAIIDEIGRIGKQLNLPAAAVALAWVQRRPGLRSTFLEAANDSMHAGATVNGEPSVAWPPSPKSDADRY